MAFHVEPGFRIDTKGHFTLEMGFRIATKGHFTLK
jgi:hypothetical protein